MLLFWETSHLLVPSSCLIVKGHGEEEYGSYCAHLGFFEPSTTPQLHVIRESSATGTPKNMVKIHGQNMSKRKNSVKKSVLLVISISFPMIVSWISPWQLSKESMASKPMAAIGFGLPRSCLNFRPRWQSAELHISSRVSIPRKARLPLLEMPIFPRTEKWPDRYRQINPVTSTQVPVAQAGVARRHYSCNGCGRVQLRLHWGLQ